MQFSVTIYVQRKKALIHKKHRQFMMMTTKTTTITERKYEFKDSSLILPEMPYSFSAVR